MISENSEKEELEEFVRLFYVAVTRAVERLYLVECVEDKGIPFTDRLTMDDLKEYRGGTLGMTMRALRHDDEEELDPATGFPLFAMEEAEILPVTGTHKKPQAVHFPRWSGSSSLLPEMITPSSLERPRMQKEPVRFLPPLSFAENKGTEYGTMMHELAEALPDDRAWNAELIRDTAESLGYDRSAVYDRSAEDLIDFQNSDLYRSCSGMEIHKEFPFYSEAFGRMNGSIDFAAVGTDRILLIDFKTDRKTPEEIRDDYSGQLNAYRRILETAYPGRRVEAYAWSFHNRCAVIIEEE